MIGTIACYFHMCLIVGLKIKMCSFVWCLRTRIFRSDEDYSSSSPVCRSVRTRDLAGQRSLFNTTSKSHSDRVVSYLLLLLVTAKNNWMSVKEDAFLSIYIPPCPGFVYFLHLTAVCVFAVAMFSLYCQLLPCCLGGYFTPHQEKKCLKMGKCNFYSTKKPHPQVGEKWSPGQVW